MKHNITKSQNEILLKIRQGARLTLKDEIYVLISDQHDSSRSVVRKSVEKLLELRLIENDGGDSFILTHDGRESIEEL